MLVIELTVGCLIQKNTISGNSQRLPQSTKSIFLNVFYGMNPKAKGDSCSSRLLMK